MSEALPAATVTDRFRTLRIVSIVEATTYLILLVAAVVKRTSDFELGVKVMGPFHGLLFLAYVALILMNRSDMAWSWLKAIAAMVLGALPFGGYWVERSWIPREPS
jgi:integral membrane protein